LHLFDKEHSLLEGSFIMTKAFMCRSLHKHRCLWNSCNAQRREQHAT
jgi:hypothetical protein